MNVVATWTQSLLFHNHNVVNVEAKITKSWFVIPDFAVVNVVLKCEYIYIYIFAMTIYVENVVAAFVSTMELKFVFFFRWVTA